nr:immunoglobulin light chain junction region [Macaca mulatta]
DYYCAIWHSRVYIF